MLRLGDKVFADIKKKSFNGVEVTQCSSKIRTVIGFFFSVYCQSKQTLDLLDRNISVARN